MDENCFAEIQACVLVMKLCHNALILSQSEGDEDSLKLIALMSSQEKFLQQFSQPSDERRGLLLTCLQSFQTFENAKEEGAFMEKVELNLTSIVERAAKAALEKWKERISPYCDIAHAQALFNPRNAAHTLAKNCSFPLSLKRYLPINQSQLNRVLEEWRVYLELLSVQLKSSEAKKVYDEISISEWWQTQADNGSFGHDGILLRYVEFFLAIRLSGAEVERSFKKLRRTLPKDHSRDNMNDDLIESEMFFGYNRELIQLFGSLN